VEEKANWVVKHWPIILVAATMVAWGVRLEERLAYHVALPYHGQMQETRDDLVQIKTELKFLREDVQEIKQLSGGNN